MNTRCTNPKDKYYGIYGGRGIKVCDMWSDFENFRNEMYESYLSHVERFGESNTSIDRICSDGDYSLENCRWATSLEQVRNRRCKSGHVGVNRSSDGSGWVATIGVDYKLIYLGFFKELSEALEARKNAEKLYWKGTV
jgi:hypothetical protein